MASKQIEIFVYEPTGKGTLRHVRNLTLGEIETQVKASLKEAGLWDRMDYFGIRAVRETVRDLSAPNFNAIACFAVTGGSEGHYIHVDFVLDNGRLENFLLGKTFEGMDAALQIAGHLTKLLPA